MIVASLGTTRHIVPALTFDIVRSAAAPASARALRMKWRGGAARWRADAVGYGYCSLRGRDLLDSFPQEAQGRSLATAHPLGALVERKGSGLMGIEVGVLTSSTLAKPLASPP